MLRIEDEADFDAVVEEFSDILFRIAFQHTENRADAEDIVQDAFVKLLKSKRAFEDKEHLKAWLLRVTINRCRDLRRSFFRSNVVSIDNYLSIEPSQGQNFDTFETSEVWQKLCELPKPDRICLYLHYYEGYTIRETAELVGKSEDAVNSKLSRARRKLGNLLKEDLQ